ncbi:MAG: MBL fold metallo-hydrolase [Methanomicrobiales archaeon]|nr:MBL fold metallo-hydrolase [Methanomicrobiales archaeon]
MQVTPAIQALRHPFKIPVAPGITLDRFVYSYLVFGETITLVDCGVAGCETAIFTAIRSCGRDPREISLIILTHSHPDHIGAARTIREETGCSIMAHSAERGWIEDVERQNRERPVPGFSTLVAGSVPLDNELADGDVIDLDGTKEYEIEVIHTPGHSAGSISLFLPAERALFCGDAVPVEGDLPVYEDALESVRSLNKLKGVRGIHTLLSAWDEPREGETAYGQIEKGLRYIQKIHASVLHSAGSGNTEPVELARTVAGEIGLPPQAVSHLLARTLAGHLRYKNREDILVGR